MTTTNKKQLTERDICTKFITPAIEQSDWDLLKQIREEAFFTKGRIIVRGKVIARGKAKKADYILYHKPNLPLAIVEAKDNNHSLDSGMQQALDYADILDIPFAYSSNGDGFIEHDRTKTSGPIEREISLEQFPTAQELYEKYKQWKGINEIQEKIINQDYYSDIDAKIPHYFQQVAINRTVEAIAKGKDRLLLVMATGTGKTFTAFQIIWRLWKSGTKKRILFLVDRNILADQTMVNDFKHFGDKMTKIKQRQVDKSYEVYLALYQGVTGIEDWKNIYKQFSPDFFDLVVVDECHRGSAAEDAAWHEILEYYSKATQVGLTATPRETKDVSNIQYFGEPIYTYSLKQGIEDGFLAPYKVVRISLDKDLEGWRPQKGQLDKYGNEIEDRIYNAKDYDRTLIIDERTKVVAQKITQYLKETNRYDKTIVFCRDIAHAERITRALINENADLFNKNSKYIIRITGDNEIGKAELDNFIDPESRYPVIAVTSKLMTTGVDAQTCKLIILDTIINSMTEFKQIIGRGTRIREDFNKFYFTIIDFRNATEHFADPEFDGEPVQIYEPEEGDSPVPTDLETQDEESEQAEEEKDEGVETDIDVIFDPDEEDAIGDAPPKYYVNGIEVKVINERVQYIDKNGKLITESLRDYSKNSMVKEFSSLDNFLKKWISAEKKQVIIEELLDQGVLFEELNKEVGKDLDPFDLICHIAFGKPPLTRKERAENVRKRNYFSKYEDNARQVLEALLDKYADQGIISIEELGVLNVQPFPEFGSAYEIINDIFGGRDKYLQAVKELEDNIYSVA